MVVVIGSSHLDEQVFQIQAELLCSFGAPVLLAKGSKTIVVIAEDQGLGLPSVGADVQQLEMGREVCLGQHAGKQQLARRGVSGPLIRLPA